MRAMKGEDAESELRNMGVPRRWAVFGVNVGIPFDRHLPISFSLGFNPKP